MHFHDPESFDCGLLLTHYGFVLADVYGCFVSALSLDEEVFIINVQVHNVT